MSRPLRLKYPAAVYHLTSRGTARQKIFWNDDDRKLFLGTLAQVVKRSGWVCHAYCLINNHWLCRAPHNTGLLLIEMGPFRYPASCKDYGAGAVPPSSIALAAAPRQRKP